MKLDASKLQDLVASIKEQFSFAHHLSVGMCSVNALRNTFLTQQCPSYLHMTMVVLLMLRALGLEVRLVYSMQPVAVKETKATKAASATKRKTPAKSKNTVKEELSGSEAEGKPKTKVRAKRTAGKRKRAQSESGEEEADEKKSVKDRQGKQQRMRLGKERRSKLKRTSRMLMWKCPKRNCRSMKGRRREGRGKLPPKRARLQR